MSVLTSISINGDETQEDSETFTVTVTTANSNDVIDGSNMATVTILDDNDGIQEFHSTLGCIYVAIRAMCACGA